MVGEMRIELVGDLEIVTTRDFAAPRDLVFEAWTNPEHVRRWWGLRRQSLALCQIDLRPGGKWRYVLREADGKEVGFNGVYREIEAPAKVVATYRYEPMPEFEAVTTTTFTERNGVTTVRDVCRHNSKEERDGHYYSGMEQGMRECFDRLTELLESICNDQLTAGGAK